MVRSPLIFPSQYGNVEDLEKCLTDKLRKAEDMVKSAKKKIVCPIKFLHANLPLSDNWTIVQMKENYQDLNVFHNIDLYIDERKTEVKPSTLKVIGVMKDHLKCFEKYRIDNIDEYRNKPSHLTASILNFILYLLSTLPIIILSKGKKKLF